MLELLQRHRHLRSMQISCISLPHGEPELLQRKPLSNHRPRVLQGDITIRLNGERLIKLWRQAETQCDNVALVEPVKRTAFSSEPRVSSAVRFPGFCSRHSCAPRSSPG